jgi:hypothetical protein
VGEQHDLSESHVLQFVEAIDDCGRCADQTAFVKAERRYSETLFGELLHGRQGCVIGCQCHHGFDRHHDGGRVAADVVAVLSQHGDLVIQLAERIRGHVPDVGIPCHQGQRVLLADAAHHDRWPGLPNGSRLDRHVPHSEMLAREVDSLVGECLMQYLQRLTEPLGALRESAPVQADARVLVLDGSAADPELKAPGRDLVEGRCHLREHGRMAKLVAQHHVSDLDAFGAAEQCGRQGPCLERGVVRGAGSVQVVVEPQRVDAEFLTAQCAVQDVGVAEAHLGQVDADLGPRHVRSSNLPWVMVVAPLAAASNANERWSMP